MLVDTARKAAELLSPFLSSEEAETVAVLHLDSERRLIGTTFSPAGGLGEVELPVREILASALRMGAASIVVAHNHPSGDSTPSQEDLAATRQLADAARSAGLHLADHLVFGGGECRSFRELGLL